MRKFIFVDTNIFEHFPSLTDIHWADLVGCSSVTLVIPQVTIRELNRHKDTSQKPLQKRRAADALRKLSEWSRLTPPVAIRPSVELEFSRQEPLIDFATFRLRRDVPDDELLASAIEFAADRHLDPSSVLVSSADLGLQLKGQSQETIRMLIMPESLRLPDEPDSEDKREKGLEERLQQISSHLPNINLAFLGGLTFEEWTLSRAIWPIDENEIKEKLRILRFQNPYLAGHPSPPPGWTSSSASKKERDEYNIEMAAYYLLHERFLRSSIEVRNWQARTRSLCLILGNSGSAPAEEINICLGFPPGIEIIRDSDLKAIPSPPKAPDFPAVNGANNWLDVSGEQIEESHQETSDAPNAVITGIGKSLGCFEVGILVSHLKHTFSESLSVVNIHFPSVAEFRSFQFTYKMVASNFPHAVEGKLNVKVTVIN